MLNLKKIILVGGMTAVVALTGCETSNHEASNNSGGRSEGRKLDDSAITAAVKRDLEQAPDYKFNTVDVRTYAGVVQLSGFVDTPDQKNRAGDIASHEDGVTQVMNNINLKPKPMEPTGRP
jgi:hyperosmotically inducible protein